MLGTNYYTSLSQYLKNLLPEQLFNLGNIDFLDKLAYEGGLVFREESSLTANLTIGVMQEVSFEFLGGLSLVIGRGIVDTSMYVELDEEDNVTDFSLTISSQVVKIRLPRSFFLPVIEQEGKLILDPDPNHFVEITVPFGIAIDKEFNIEIMWPGEQEETALDLPLCMLGESQVIISASTVLLRTSIFQSLPQEALELGLDSDWKGLFMGEVKVYLPEEIGAAVPRQIQFKNCFIGQGGFTGGISLDFTPALTGTLFEFDFSLNHFSISFIENTLSSSKIQGTITPFPFFDAPLALDIFFTSQGDFLASASSASEEDLYKLTKEGLLEMSLKYLSLSIKKKTLAISMGGELKPLLGEIEWPSFEVKRLTIDSQGKVAVEGGWIDLPESKSFHFHGFTMEISKVGFGQNDDGYRWMGFSGGIQIVGDLPLKGGVEGLKILWKEGETPRFQIGGVSVASRIKDVLDFKGTVAFIEKEKGFKGSVSVVVDSLEGMTFNGQFMTGRTTQEPSFTYFYLFIDMGSPLGIPLGATGLSLYGMGALFGYHRKPSKQQGQTWNDFFLQPPVGITSFDKWVGDPHQLAFGAGVTLGTTPDNGFTFATKALLLVSVPGPTILVEGCATLLQKRSELEGNPPLRMLAVLDKRAGTFLMNIHAKYDYPKNSGKIIDIQANGEAYFNVNNPAAWHLYLGQKTPESKRVQAKLLSLFQSTCFFMMDAKGFITGGGSGYSNSWRVGPLQVILKAWMETEMGISWRPAQAEGSIHLDGEVRLKACGRGIGLSIGAMLSARTPTPWHIKGDFKVKLNLPWPLPDPKATIKLEWKKEEQPSYINPLESLAMEHVKVNETWPLEVNQEHASWIDSPVVPLDAKIAIHFARPIEDSAGFGKNRDTRIQEDLVGPYHYKYKLVNIKIEKKRKAYPAEEWTYYKGEEELKNQGTWQAITQEGGLKNLKLLMGVETPFAISRTLETNETWLSPFVHQWPYYPCEFDASPSFLCVEYQQLSQGSVYHSLLSHQGLLYYSIGGIQVNKYKEKHALRIGKSSFTPSFESPLYNLTPFQDLVGNRDLSGGLIILFPEDMERIELFLAENSKGVCIGYDEQGIPWEVGGFDFAVSPEKQEPILLQKAKAPLRALLIKGEFAILKICMLTFEEALKFSKQLEQYQLVKETLAEEWKSQKIPLWDPQCFYKITVMTEARRKKAGNWENPQLFSEVSYFQTMNPPGMPEVNELSQQQEEKKNLYPYGGGLVDLRPYVMETIPGLVPPSEEQRPFYRSYDVGIKFNEPLGVIDAMYEKAGAPLTIQLFDNNDQPLRGENGEEIILQNQWDKNRELLLTREEMQWKEFLDQSGCVQIKSSLSYPQPSNLYVGGPDFVLDPQTFYQAKLTATSKQMVPTSAFIGEIPHMVLEERQKKDVVYEFSFVTSRYAHFTHHIHSFIGKPWSYFHLKGKPQEPFVDAESLLELQSLSSQGKNIHTPDSYDKEQEDKNFQILMKLFKVGARLPPEKLELLLLNNATTTYAVLLESPEPLEWERIKLELEYRTKEILSSTPLTSAKFIEARIEKSGFLDTNYNQEKVVLLLSEPMNLSGWKIQKKTKEETDYLDYYLFEGGDKFSAGTILHIHSGTEPLNPLPEEDIHLYHQGLEEGESWQFSAEGVSLRLLDIEGKIVHEYFAGIYETNQPTTLIRNLDQSKAFILLADENQNYLPFFKGNFALRFAFQRNLGSKGPLLKRRGSEKEEWTMVEFNTSQFLP